MFGHTIMVGVGLPFLMGIETRVLEVFTLTLYHPLTNQFAQSKLQTLQDGRVCPKLPKRNSVARTEARDRKYSNFLGSFLFPIIVLSTFNITSHEALFINSNRNVPHDEHTRRLVYYVAPSSPKRLYHGIATHKPTTTNHTRVHTRSSVPRIRRCRGSVRFASSRE